MEWFDDDSLDLSPGLLEHVVGMAHQETADIEDFFGMQYDPVDNAAAGEVADKAGKRTEEMQEAESRPKKRLCSGEAMEGVAREAASFIQRFAEACTGSALVPQPVSEDEARGLSGKGAMFVLSLPLMWLPHTPWCVSRSTYSASAGSRHRSRGIEKDFL